MSHNVWNYAILDLLTEIETTEILQNDVKRLYDKVYQTLLSEMDSFPK